MTLGSVFISHKHKDKEIARVVGSFIKEESGNRIDIFLSSSPQFTGPRAGKRLDEELEHAIEKSGVVILIYTGKSAQVDWEYCIYECAYASSRGIRVVVFQCMEDAPAPFLGTVRLPITEQDSVHKFTKDFLTSPDFFLNQKEKVTHLEPTDPIVKKKADTFHKTLTQAVEKYLGKEPASWSAWPSLRLRLGKESAERISKAREDRAAVATQELREEIVVIASDGADSIFGLGIDPGIPFGKLVESWQESYPEEGLEWLDLLGKQIEKFENKRFPELRDARLPEAKGDSNLLPVVVSMLSYPLSHEIEFDLRFFDVRPRSQAIQEIMIKKEEVYCKLLDADGTSSLDLKKLYKDMKNRRIYRLPMLDESWHLLYMIHRSVISEFLLETDADKPTVQHLLDAPGMKEGFGQTIAFVDSDATVEEAREALAKVDGARDLFVTADGGREEPVLGMVTNTDLERPA